MLTLLLCGCAGGGHVIGYDITKTSLLPPTPVRVYILPFEDQRPKQERAGVKGKLLSFSSKDGHFSKKVAWAIAEVLAEELNSVGFSVVETEEAFDYKITGIVQHFQAIMSPAKITFLPYLGPVSTVWAKDEFNIALSIYIKMIDNRGLSVIDKTFVVSNDMKISPGLLNLVRYSRGFHYKLKLLDVALKDVMGQIRDEVINKAKK